MVNYVGHPPGCPAPASSAIGSVTVKGGGGAFTDLFAGIDATGAVVDASASIEAIKISSPLQIDSGRS